MMKTLFEKALSIDPPWFVKEIRFDEEQKQLDIFGSSSFQVGNWHSDAARRHASFGSSCLS